MEQQPSTTLYRDGYDALRRMLDGFDSETVGQWMIDAGFWPRLTRTTAAARVRACLNADKVEFFKQAEVLFLMQRTGRLDPLHHLCDSLGIPRPDGALAMGAEARLALLREQRALLIGQLQSVDELIAALEPAADKANPSLDRLPARRLRFSRRPRALGAH